MRRFMPTLVALLLIGTLFFLSQQPTLSEQQADDLAARFSL